MLHNFAETLRELRRSYRDALSPYRPELYYMRGPGPACRAKRAGLTSVGAPLGDASVVLGKFAEVHG